MVVKCLWFVMICMIWGDLECFKKSYYLEEFGGMFYLVGDGMVCDKEIGYFMIMGWIDDVLNVLGYWFGMMEIELVLVLYEFVVEVVVVGCLDDMMGEVVVVFVVLKCLCLEGDEVVVFVKMLCDWVGK